MENFEGFYKPKKDETQEEREERLEMGEFTEEEYEEMFPQPEGSEIIQLVPEVYVKVN